MEHIEIWKDVVGWESRYAVSNKGKVLSKLTGLQRKQRVEKLGYCSVDLWDNYKMKRLKVHRMVALAFLENAENKPQVNHKDGNKANNNVANLEWVTAQQNSIHAYQTGLSKPRKGMKHGRSKLTDIEACFIYHSDLPSKDLSKEFGVSRELADKIKRGLLWKETTQRSIKGTYVNT